MQANGAVLLAAASNPALLQALRKDVLAEFKVRNDIFVARIAHAKRQKRASESAGKQVRESSEEDGNVEPNTESLNAKPEPTPQIANIPKAPQAVLKGSKFNGDVVVAVEVFPKEVSAEGVTVYYAWSKKVHIGAKSTRMCTNNEILVDTSQAGKRKLNVLVTAPNVAPSTVARVFEVKPCLPPRAVLGPDGRTVTVQVQCHCALHAYLPSQNQPFLFQLIEKRTLADHETTLL